MSDALKDKLKSVEAQLDEARNERAAKAKERDAAREAFAGIDGADTSSPEFQQARKAVEELGQVEQRISGLSEAQVGILKMLGNDPAITRKADTGGDDRDETGEWSAKSLFTDELVAKLERAANTKGRVGPMELGQVASRDALKADVTGTSSMRRGAFAGVVTQLRRRITLLDLISVGTTDGNLVPYTQESGTYNAAETAESSLKPEGGLIYTDVDANVRTIAAWQKMPKQALADVASMASVIEGRLRYGVQRRLEDQVLAGSGVSPNLQGILATAGIGSVPFGASTPLGELILSSMTQVMLAEAEPTGIVLNPSDWQKILTTKATGSGEYLNEVEPVLAKEAGLESAGLSAPLIPTLWGVPVVHSTVIPAGTALVGDWTIGCQLFIREGVNVLMSDSDQSDFISNRVTLLAEMRAALAVWRPAAFSKAATA
jgi:HK97 family phage major capsid protein